MALSVMSFFALANMLQGYGVVQAASIAGRFDTADGTNVLTGNFASNVLQEVENPLVDAQIQAYLQDGGFKYAPLG